MLAYAEIGIREKSGKPTERSDARVKADRAARITLAATSVVQALKRLDVRLLLERHKQRAAEAAKSARLQIMPSRHGGHE